MLYTVFPGLEADVFAMCVQHWKVQNNDCINKEWMPANFAIGDFLTGTSRKRLQTKSSTLATVLILTSPYEIEANNNWDNICIFGMLRIISAAFCPIGILSIWPVDHRSLRHIDLYCCILGYVLFCSSHCHISGFMFSYFRFWYNLWKAQLWANEPFVFILRVEKPN